MAEFPGCCKERELVKRIATSNGHISEEAYAKMDHGALDAIHNLREHLGNSLILLAQQIYSTEVRFIFELLQNADDTRYSQAQAMGQEPRIIFRLYKHKLVIESNEDGFDEANLRAICSIKRSSKVGSHDCIGEKGIGFKSVFKVAYKALIQSGYYSFSFTHHLNDNGLGMVIPEWEDSVGEGPDEGWTRITLCLHEDSEAPARHQDILNQLDKLDNTMLLFLRKLRRIDIRIYDEGDNEVSSTTLFVSINETTQRATLTRQSSVAGEAPVIIRTFCHIAKHLATGLAKSPNRTYTAIQEETKSYEKAEVARAFPLTSDDVPIVEAQQIFAFLPIRRLGFKFLIHTDFVTMANREDVETTAPRNLGLLEGIAEAFIKIIQEMYNHRTLRYQWMRYLAGMKEYPWDGFWKLLVDKISFRLDHAAILEARRRGSPRRIRDLRTIPSSVQNSQGDPLFDDLPGSLEMYVSTGYEKDDRDILEDYHLKPLSQAEIIARVRHDLSLANSRMRNPKTTSNWHTRAAKAINEAWKENWKAEIADTRALRLLPQISGSWISANEVSAGAGRVVLATLDSGIAVPANIASNILSPSACANLERAKLFKNLGACSVSAQYVRSKVLKSFSESQRQLVFLDARSMLEFLYQTCDHKPGTFSEYDKKKVAVHDSSSILRSPRQVECLFPSDHDSSPWQLYLWIKRKHGEKEAQSFLKTVAFINKDYFNVHPQPSKPGSPSWCDWLEAGIGVRRFPRLVDSSGKGLSKLCIHIANEIPSRFLDFLEYTWESEKESVLNNAAVLQQLKSMKVMCSSNEGLMQRLERTYLPLPGLQQKVSDLLGKEEWFPFLWLGGRRQRDDDLGRWGFLSRDLAVSTQDDAKFYLDILFCIQMATAMRKIAWQHPERVRDIYTRLHNRLSESTDQNGEAETVIRQVDDRKLVYTPASEDDKEDWLMCSDCLLGAPRNLQHKVAIDTRYKAAFPEADLTPITRVFQKWLRIATYSWKDTIRELQHLRFKESSDYKLIHSQYVSLKKANKVHLDGFTTSFDPESMRQDFQNHSLVFIPAEGSEKCSWVAPSECLWGDATEIEGRISLSRHYDDRLEEFFVSVLNVPRLDVNMVYDELLRVDPCKATVKQTKSLVWQMNTLLAQGEKPNGMAEDLLKFPILPVEYPNGDVQLCSGENEFCIVDRRPLKELFQGKLKLLAFDLQEVHKLRPFLEWGLLEQRYLSRMAKKSFHVDRSLVFPVSDPTRDMARKAHALTRVAVHLQSPRSQDIQVFYDRLRDTETRETDAMFSEVTIIQDSDTVSGERQRTEVYIDENAEPLVIYVPRNEFSREVCFGSTLPQRLFKWMATDPATNLTDTHVDDSIVAVLTGILATKSAAAINTILENNGIIDVDIPGLVPQPEHNADMSPDVSTSGSDSPGTTFTSGTANATPGNRYASPEAIASSAPFRRLLAHVIRAARATAVLPNLDTASFVPDAHTVLRPPPRSEDEGPLFSPNFPLTKQDKVLVGAAGELFVFELLRAVLSDSISSVSSTQRLSRDVWQSKIRALVAEGHDEYADMPAWPIDEKADIILDGRAAAALVSLLLAKGYLGEVRAKGLRRCYVEVKTTWGAYTTPFFMSPEQYDKMSHLSTQDSIYMIFRVFNIANNSIGVRMYVDPGKMRNRLEFKAEKWKVTPG